MTIDVSNNNPRVEYSVAEGVTQTVFSVPFDYFEDSDVTIYVDGEAKVLGTDYTMTGGDGSTGTITFVTATPPEVQQVTGATGGSIVVIVRRIPLERVTDFVAGQDINRAALNTQLDNLVAIAADLDDRLDRTIHIPDNDPADITFELPNKDTRANKYLAFGPAGDVVVTSGTTSDIVVSSFAETLIDDTSAEQMLTTLGFTATLTQLNYTQGVTSNIQTQIDGKVSAASPTFTGTATIPTANITTANITTIDLGDWTITESAGVLYFAIGGVNKMKLDATGNLTVAGDVTAFGTV